MFDPTSLKSLQMYSSAVSLSDMEMFIFPDLLFSLTLANIMSPRLWEWKDDPWFEEKKRLSEYKRILRVKQYIMEHFSFNLDLETWGLTTKEKELKRFQDFVDEDTLAQSNALFGYEGDKYYFDIDIRRHFGLDQYDSDVIPYWKTETLEAMEAFQYKESYPAGAGECVSLSALYAAALWVVAKIPMSKIFMMATPLHSQNFVLAKDGIITNNRRIVTKNMWFNGTELSAKARRALENERVTIVTHHTGSIHTIYKNATINPDAYQNFQRELSKYLKTNINFEILCNFLRNHRKFQECFQITCQCFGKPRYIELETVFHYEHGSRYRVSDNTREKLLQEIDEDEFYPSPLEDRIILDELESYFTKNQISIDELYNLEDLKQHLHTNCFKVREVVEELVQFCKIEPRLPEINKKWTPRGSIEIDQYHSREEVIGYLKSIRKQNEVADLAFYAYRDLSQTHWYPFLKAAFERNPVSNTETKNWPTNEVYSKLNDMENISIYNHNRIAQPDEVWNYQRGDGLEKMIAFLNIIRKKNRNIPIEISYSGEQINLEISNNQKFIFKSKKDLDTLLRKDFFGSLKFFFDMR